MSQLCIAHYLEKGADPTVAFKCRRTQIIETESELLVLGTDFPLVLRSRAGSDEFHELIAIGDRRFLYGAGSGHGRSLCNRAYMGAISPQASPAARRALRRVRSWLARRTVAPSPSSPAARIRRGRQPACVRPRCAKACRTWSIGHGTPDRFRGNRRAFAGRNP